MLLDVLKVLLLSIVEGITEWLPVSSTGHMILVEEFLSIKHMSVPFYNMFLYVIQLGAILAVLVLFWSRLYPFSRSRSKEERLGILRLWGLVLIGVLPAAVIGLAFDDLLEAHVLLLHLLGNLLLLVLYELELSLELLLETVVFTALVLQVALLVQQVVLDLLCTLLGLSCALVALVDLAIVLTLELDELLLGLEQLLLLDHFAFGLRLLEGSGTLLFYRSLGDECRYYSIGRHTHYG